MAKRVLVVGHSRGLGAHLMRCFSERGWTTYGCGLSTGHDLREPKLRSDVIRLASDYDVVINNARAGFAQVSFLSELYETWLAADREGTIVNIGSLAFADYLSRENPREPYFFQKQALNSMSRAMNVNRGRVRVICVNPGYMATERIVARGLSLSEMLDPAYVAETVIWLLSQPANVHISEITLSAWSPIA